MRTSNPETQRSKAASCLAHRRIAVNANRLDLDFSPEKTDDGCAGIVPATLRAFFGLHVGYELEIAAVTNPQIHAHGSRSDWSWVGTGLR